jgi:hypothetical protein
VALHPPLHQPAALGEGLNLRQVELFDQRRSGARDGGRIDPGVDLGGVVGLRGSVKVALIWLTWFSTATPRSQVKAFTSASVRTTVGAVNLPA